MANPEHLKILKQGVGVWNRWRKENPDIIPDLSKAHLFRAKLSPADLSNADLSGAHLTVADLREANLSDANLSGAELIGTNLSGANLHFAVLSGAIINANLTGADLRWADFRGTNLLNQDLSGVKINEWTAFSKKSGIEIGINGVYCESTESAALISLTPRGNSMQGSNPDVVIESLARARRLHGYSLTLAGFAILIALLNLPKLKFPNIEGLEVTPDTFILLAIPISIAILIITNLFFKSALDGARYVQDRDSAMKIGNFSWSLSKYTTSDPPKFKRGAWGKIGDPKFKILISNYQYAFNRYKFGVLSFYTRVCMAFHPLVYVYFLEKWIYVYLLEERGGQKLILYIFFVYIFLMITLLALSFWTFSISQNFQKPILFDAKTEERHKTDIEKLTIAVENQTAELKKLVDLIKPQKQRGAKVKKE